MDFKKQKQLRPDTGGKVRCHATVVCAAVCRSQRRALTVPRDAQKYFKRGDLEAKRKEAYFAAQRSVDCESFRKVFFTIHKIQ